MLNANQINIHWGLNRLTHNSLFICIKYDPTFLYRSSSQFSHSKVIWDAPVPHQLRVYSYRADSHTAAPRVQFQPALLCCMPLLSPFLYYQSSRKYLMRHKNSTSKIGIQIYYIFNVWVHILHEVLYIRSPLLWYLVYSSQEHLALRPKPLPPSSLRAIIP